MSHSLPSVASPLRQLFEVADVVAIATGERAVPTIGDAIRHARRWLAQEQAAKAVHVIAISADDTIALHRVGPRGGHTRLWVFGKATRQTRVA